MNADDDSFPAWTLDMSLESLTPTGPMSGVQTKCVMFSEAATTHRLLSPPIRARHWPDGPMIGQGFARLTSLIHAQPVFNAVQSYARSL